MCPYLYNAILKWNSQNYSVKTVNMIVSLTEWPPSSLGNIDMNIIGFPLGLGMDYLVINGPYISVRDISIAHIHRKY